MKSKKSSFQGKVTKASKKTAQRNSNFGYLNLPKGVNVFKPENDSSVILDFLPYKVTMANHPDKDEKDGTAVKGSMWYRLPFKRHNNVGTPPTSVVCPSSFGKKCPVCEYRAKKIAEKADKEDIDALKTSPRYLYVVNPLDSPKHDKGKYHIFDISHAMFQQLLDEELEENNVSEIFMDPTEGESLKVRFKGRSIGKGGSPFPEAKKITPVKRAKQYDESIADETPKLDEILVMLSYEELEKKFFQLEDEGTEDEDDDEPRKKKSSKKVVEEEDDEEEPEDDDDDDDEEEEPVPTRNKKKVETSKKSSKKVVEEDDDEEEDEDDEPDEISWEMLNTMKFAALSDFCKLNKLKTKPKEYDDDVKALRIAIGKEAGLKVPKAKTKPVVEDDDDEEDEEPTPKKKGSKTTSKAGSSKDKCPYGYRFGIDTDKKDECDSCDLWDECMEAKKKNSK